MPQPQLIAFKHLLAECLARQGAELSCFKFLSSCHVTEIQNCFVTGEDTEPGAKIFSAGAPDSKLQAKNRCAHAGC